MGPKVGLPGWKQKNRAIFGARLGKTQHADCAALSPRFPSGWKVLYSIVTASRPINRATSSNFSEWPSWMTRASRTRHSSSLIEGTSLGTIDGTGFMESSWKSVIKSPLRIRQGSLIGE
jgi:hypothetical protein